MVSMNLLCLEIVGCFDAITDFQKFPIILQNSILYDLSKLIY